MSRPLTPLGSLLLAATLLAGCSPYPRDIAGNTSSDGSSFSSTDQWLSLEQSVSEMRTEEIVAKLVRVNKPEGVGQLYYYGLLNHHLETYGAWTLARDTFREVLEYDTLSESQRQLVTVLEAFNQSRINMYLRQQELLKRYQQMQEDFTAADTERQELQKKIDALTEVEAVISTRKEQD